MENDCQKLEKITIHKKMIMLMKYRREILWDIMGDFSREEAGYGDTEKEQSMVENTFDTETIPF